MPLQPAKSGPALSAGRQSVDAAMLDGGTASLPSPPNANHHEEELLKELGSKLTFTSRSPLVMVTRGMEQLVEIEGGRVPVAPVQPPLTNVVDPLLSEELHPGNGPLFADCDMDAGVMQDLLVESSEYLLCANHQQLLESAAYCSDCRNRRQSQLLRPWFHARLASVIRSQRRVTPRTQDVEIQTMKLHETCSANTKLSHVDNSVQHDSTDDDTDGSTRVWHCSSEDEAQVIVKVASNVSQCAIPKGKERVVSSSFLDWIGVQQEHARLGRYDPAPNSGNADPFSQFLALPGKGEHTNGHSNGQSTKQDPLNNGSMSLHRACLLSPRTFPVESSSSYLDSSPDPSRSHTFMQSPRSAFSSRISIPSLPSIPRS